MKDKFVQFLQANNCFLHYNYNLNKEHKTLDGIVDYYDPQYILIYSFCWANTNEGEKYWADIDKNWREELKRIRLSIKQHFYVKRFKLFLKRNKCHYEFIYNFSKTGKSDVNLFLEKTTKLYFVELAFSWAYSNEGYSFWNRIDKKWKRYVNK